MDQVTINTEEAKALRIEMETEFAEVKQILRRVNEECHADPDEDDTFLKQIESANHQLEEAWGQLESVFEDAVNKLEGIVNSVDDWIKKQVDAVTDFASKISN